MGYKLAIYYVQEIGGAPLCILWAELPNCENLPSKLQINFERNAAINGMCVYINGWMLPISSFEHLPDSCVPIVECLCNSIESVDVFKAEGDTEWSLPIGEDILFDTTSNNFTFVDVQITRKLGAGERLEWLLV